MIVSQVINITDEPHQRHELLYKNQRIDLELRYLAAVQAWIMDVSCPKGEVNGVRLTQGADLLFGTRLPYTFAIETTEGIDPFTEFCFSSGRSKLYFIDRADI